MSRRCHLSGGKIPQRVDLAVCVFCTEVVVTILPFFDKVIQYPFKHFMCSGNLIGAPSNDI